MELWEATDVALEALFPGQPNPGPKQAIGPVYVLTLLPKNGYNFRLRGKQTCLWNRCWWGPWRFFSYIVGCEKEKEGLIIDPAGSENKILSRADDMGLTIRYVVNTHGHADHTCGNRAILSKTGADLVVHREDANEIVRGLNRACSMVMGKRPSPEAQKLVTDGDFIRIGQTGLKVIHTPGHTPGSICLYGEGNLFTGDTLFVGAVGRTDLKGGSLDVLLDSLKKLLSLPPETRVWPGHDYGDAPVSTLAREKETNPYITDFL